MSADDITFVPASPSFEHQDDLSHPDGIELVDQPDRKSENANGFALPQADGGKQAWLFLLGSFMVEALIWGFAFAFGVFQDYYTTHEPFAGETNIASIGTTQTGIMYLSLPVVFAFLQRWPQIRRVSIIIGLFITSVSLVLASFAVSKTQLILTQGILYGIGGTLAYSPTVLFLDEWFIRRKGLAFGFMWAGTGLAGIIFPLVLEWGLSTYGFRVVLRAWSVGLFVLTSPLIYFVKPRLPVVRASQMRRFDLGFLKTPGFALFEIGSIVQGLGYFLPTIFLPTYARLIVDDKNVSSTLTTSLTLILFYLSGVLGCVLMGLLTDRVHVAICILISTVGSTIATFILWGTATTLAQLYVFCLAYGLFAGSFTTTYSGSARAIKKRNELADPGMVFAWLAAGRGIGSVISGPLSGALLKSGENWTASFGYSSGYGAMIVFVGITAIVGGISFPGMLLGWL